VNSGIDEGLPLKLRVELPSSGSLGRIQERNEFKRTYIQKSDMNIKIEGIVGLQGMEISWKGENGRQCA
jgi:hypothetical protein